MDINFLEELVDRLNKQMTRAINNGCEVDKWIQNKLKFNKYISYKNGHFFIII